MSFTIFKCNMHFGLFFAVLFAPFFARIIRFSVIILLSVANGHYTQFSCCKNNSSRTTVAHNQIRAQSFLDSLPKMNRIQSLLVVDVVVLLRFVWLVQCFFLVPPVVLVLMILLLLLLHHENDLLTSRRCTCIKCAMCRLWCIISAVTVVWSALHPRLIVTQR